MRARFVSAALRFVKSSSGVLRMVQSVEGFASGGAFGDGVLPVHNGGRPSVCPASRGKGEILLQAVAGGGRGPGEDGIGTGESDRQPRTGGQNEAEGHHSVVAIHGVDFVACKEDLADEVSIK